MKLLIARVAPAAILALGLVFSAGPAAALGFNWSFNGVQGMVDGLLDDAAGQAATSVMLTNAGGLTHTVPWEVIGSAVSNSWTVAAGAVTAVTFRAEDWEFGGDILELTNFAGFLFDGLTANTSVTGTVIFTAKDVPEPATALLVAGGLLVGLALRRRLA